MTATLSPYTPRLWRLEHTSWGIAGLGFIWVFVNCILVGHTPWPQQSLSLRINQLDMFTGPAPGADLTLLLAHHLHSMWGFSSLMALWAASLSAAPVLFALILRTTPDAQRPFGGALWSLGNPFVLGLIFSGYGWATVGFYSLWRLLADLPERQPHHGMPLAGVGLGVAYLTVPQFGHFVLPVAATLWLAAPQHMLTRHMRVFYLLSFTPLLMIWLSYTYTEWLYQSPRIPIADILPMAPLGAILAALFVAPLLFMPTAWAAPLSRISIAAILLLTGLHRPDAVLLAGAAALAQSALIARWGTQRLTLVGASACAVLILLALEHGP